MNIGGISCQAKNVGFKGTFMFFDYDNGGKNSSEMKAAREYMQNIKEEAAEKNPRFKSMYEKNNHNVTLSIPNELDDKVKDKFDNELKINYYHASNFIAGEGTELLQQQIYLQDLKINNEKNLWINFLRQKP